MSEQTPHQKLTKNDVVEIVIGSLLLAAPVAVTGEVWDLGSELSLMRALLISLVSLVIITFFVQIRYGHVFTVNSQKKLAVRVLTVYVLTLTVSALMLYAIGRLPAFTEPLVAIKRTVLVAFPAVFAATVVDSLHGN